MPAIDVVEMATMGGAHALHMEDRIGSLESGKLADMIVLDRDSTTMTPFYDVYSTLVYAASPHDVKTTIIQGNYGELKSQHSRRRRCARAHARPRPQNHCRRRARNTVERRRRTATEQRRAVPLIHQWQAVFLLISL